MKLRRLAAAGLGGLGVAAVANRAVAGSAGDLSPALPGQVGHLQWRGFDIAYAEAGAPEDPDILLLHGIHAAASNAEFARLFERLAANHHVIAPDLPGFGLSDRPPLVYSASLYSAFVTDFARETTDEAVCIASSLTASYAVAAQRDAGPFSRLVLICPTADTGRRRTWLRALVRSPVVGTALFNGLVARPMLRYFGEREAVADPAALTDDDVDRFWTTAHQPGAKFAPASFVSGFLDPDIELAETIGDLDVPVTLVWGEHAPFPPVDAGRQLATRGDTRLVVVDAAKLLPHYEHPDVVAEALARELPAATGGE